MTEPLRNVAASVRQRLLNGAKERGEQFELTLVRFACERLLYRLSVSPHADRFVLKGGMLFLLWADRTYRPTRDIDLLGTGSMDEAGLRGIFRELCSMGVPADGLAFDAGSLAITPIRAAQQYVGSRVQMSASLGSARIPVQVDVGIGDAVLPPPERCELPSLLDHPPARLRAYRRETVIAEKMHAMVELGELNSRMKDFHDVWWLARTFPFDGLTLQGAVQATFERRRTPLGEGLPSPLTRAFYRDAARARTWRLFAERHGGEVADDLRVLVGGGGFAAVGDHLQDFLLPLWRALGASRAFHGAWTPGGPWTETNWPTATP